MERNVHFQQTLLEGVLSIIYTRAVELSHVEVNVVSMSTWIVAEAIIEMQAVITQRHKRKYIFSMCVFVMFICIDIC